MQTFAKHDSCGNVALVETLEGNATALRMTDYDGTTNGETTAAEPTSGDDRDRPSNIRDFAQRLGLSISTVSRALNDHPNVNAETRERVLSAARASGFKLNSAGRRLRRQTNDTIGFLLSPPQMDYATPFFLGVLGSLNTELRRAGKLLLVTAAESRESELDTIRELVAENHVDALVLGRTRIADERVDFLMETGLPFATIGRSETSRPYNWVDVDHSEIGRIAAERLTAGGHRRIALLNAPENMMYAASCRAGFEAGLAQAGLRPDPGLMRTVEPTEAEGYAAARDLLAAGDRRPTAIVCVADMMAFGVYRALAEAGLTPGRDVAVIGSQDIPGAAHLTPPLTTFAMPVAEIGRLLADLILPQVDGRAAAPKQHMLTPKLVARQSDGPATA